MCHEDVLPYTSSGREPFTHELFPQFFVPSGEREGVNVVPHVHVAQCPAHSTGPLYVPRDMLSAWRDKNHHWLSLSEVHRETTEGLRVTVMPFYMGRRDEGQGSVYWWRWVHTLTQRA